MKSLYFWLLLILIVIQPSCEKEQIVEEEPAPVSVRFSSSISQNTENGRTLAENPSYLVISLQKNGESTTVSEQLSLYKINGRFITEPIDLIAGNWKITDFMLTNEDNEVLYVVPKFGSPLQDAVSKPLPMHIYVAKDVVNEIDVEVLRVGDHEAYDLGYASFNNTIVNPLRLAIFTSANPTQLASAKATIWRYGELLKSIDLEPKINLISFPEINDKFYFPKYTLKIEKEGYNTYELRFYYDDLIASLDNLLLEVTLGNEPFTFLAYAEPGYSDLDNYLFRLYGNPGFVTIDFGDGTPSLVHDLSVSDWVSHTYDAEGNYPVTITGDLHLIEVFQSLNGYGEGIIDEIDFSNLPQLKEINLGMTVRGPEVIDLSNNSNLEVVLLGEIPQLQELILPEEHFIRSISIWGSSIDDPSIDYIINNIHSNVVSHNLLDGQFTNHEQASPSPSSLAKLSELKNTYGWYVWPHL